MTPHSYQKNDENRSDCHMTGGALFAIEIGRHRDVGDAVCHLVAMTNAVPGRRATVMFGGYGDDDRDVWDIVRCVTICKAIVDSGLLQRLTRQSAWFVYRTATGMPDRTSDEYILRFVELVCGA